MRLYLISKKEEFQFEENNKPFNETDSFYGWFKFENDHEAINFAKKQKYDSVRKVIYSPTDRPVTLEWYIKHRNDVTREIYNISWAKATPKKLYKYPEPEPPVQTSINNFTFLDKNATLEFLEKNSESTIQNIEEAKFKILLKYAKEKNMLQRHTKDLSPLELWLINQIYMKDIQIVAAKNIILRTDKPLRAK